VGRLATLEDAMGRLSDARDRDLKSVVPPDTINDLVERVTKVERRLSEANDIKNVVKTIKSSSDGLNVPALVGSLVDSALDRYSKDVLARPDFALYTAGGRVIPSLTSRTYEVRPSGLGSRMLAALTGMGVIRGRPPVTALHPDTNVGSCWPFSGSAAQLGILLSRRVVVSDVTIEHASKDVALDVSSAPRDFELWGVVEDDADVRRLKEYRAELEARKRAQQFTGEEDPTLASLPPSPNHVLLAVGTYDAHATRHIQTFPVVPDTRSLNIPVSVVVLRILGTHGNPAFGCLYRVRVGGVEPAASSASCSAEHAVCTDDDDP
jgi:hypothetical protein